MAATAMNEKRFRLFTLLAASLIMTAGCSADPKEESPLAGAAIGGPFTLTDQDGRPVSDTDFEGKYRLVYFGYSFCPDVCPVDLQVAGQGLKQLEESDPSIARRIQPIFITVDPARDTPETLKTYVAAFHPRLIGLTGSEAEIREVGKRYGIYSAKRDEPGASDYLVDHSRTLLLFGPKGEPIAIIPHDKGATGVSEELRRWVR